MSILKALKTSNAVPQRASNDPVARAKLKVLAAIDDQRKLVEAKLAGQHYAPTRLVWRNNEAGEKVQISTPRRLRAGWWIDAAGQTFFSLRYASKVITLGAKDQTAVVVGQLDALPAILDTIAEAVRAGELDDQLAAAAAERGHMLRKAG